MLPMLSKASSCVQPPTLGQRLRWRASFPAYQRVVQRESQREALQGACVRVVGTERHTEAATSRRERPSQRNPPRGQVLRRDAPVIHATIVRLHLRCQLCKRQSVGGYRIGERALVNRAHLQDVHGALGVTQHADGSSQAVVRCRSVHNQQHGVERNAAVSVCAYRPCTGCRCRATACTRQWRPPSLPSSRAPADRFG